MEPNLYMLLLIVIAVYIILICVAAVFVKYIANWIFGKNMTYWQSILFLNEFPPHDFLKAVHVDHPPKKIDLNAPH